VKALKWDPKFTGVLLAGALALAGCSSSTPTPAKAEYSAPKAAPVAAAAAPSDDVFVATGPLVVENQVDIEAQREGMVSKIVADAGTMVRKGQLLATLDDRQVVSDRDAAAAKVKSIEFDVKGWEYETKVLEADLERSEKMWESQLITKQDLDHARYKVQADKYETERMRQNLVNAQEALRTSNLELEKTRISAPFDGVVGRRYVRVGDKVTPNEKLFWVTAVGPLRMRFTLPEKFIGTIKLGQQLELATVAVAKDEKHPAKVIAVSPVVDPATGTIEVLAEVVGAPKDLHAGMTANINIPSPK
jgi:membrane fusion protein (multidrug efflux system)